jgi:hypothetical protein
MMRSGTDNEESFSARWNAGTAPIHDGQQVGNAFWKKIFSFSENSIIFVFRGDRNRAFVAICIEALVRQ